MPATEGGSPFRGSGSPLSSARALAEQLDRLGGVPLHRVRLTPAPGTATLEDLVEPRDGRKLRCELVDGVLVEKAMGFRESLLAAVLIRALGRFLDRYDLGIVLGADAALQLAPGLIRMPDVAFFSWQKLPGRRLPEDPVPHLVPDLAVEVLSRSNTAAEMDRKLEEYLAAHVRLLWYVDPESRTVCVHDSPTGRRVLTEAETLDGGAVLPGFRLPLLQLFGALGG